MAEAGISPALTPPAIASWTKLVTCRYFKHGACKKGGECRYSHDLTDSKPADRICKYFQKGNCAYGDRCWFLHIKPAKNDVLPTFQMPSLPSTSLADPLDAQPSGSLPRDITRQKTRMKPHDEEKIPFIIERSKGMICGVCMEVVLDKEDPEERRFGILTDCSHCCCLTCIRKWRRTAQNERKVKKSCPACQITSKFFIPSEYWVEDEDGKQKLVQNFMENMHSKPCRYFDEGRGRCRFGSNCVYRHAFPEGRLEEAQAQRRLRSSNRGTGDTPHSLNVEFSDKVDNSDERVSTLEATSAMTRIVLQRFATETNRLPKTEHLI